MKIVSRPGNDGLTKELSRNSGKILKTSFWIHYKNPNINKNTLLTTYNLQRRALLNDLKNLTRIKDVSNWWPTSLLNFDQKISSSYKT